MNSKHLAGIASAILSLLVIGLPALADQTAPAVVPNYRMGVATHFDLQRSRPFWDAGKLMPMIADAGLGYIRDGCAWKNVEKTKGVYEIEPQTLAWISLANQYHLKVIFDMDYGNRLYTDRYDPDAYSKCVAAVATQLKGQIAAFEILNEPANFGFSKVYGGAWNGMEKDGTNSPWLGKYVNLINRASAAIKAVDPTVKVIGLGSVPPANHRMLTMGIAPTVDGIVDHPYSFRFPPEILPYAATEGILKRDGIAVADDRGTFTSVIDQYRQAASKFNGPKEIWLTEWGFTTYQPIKPNLYAGYTESAQAKYMLRRFVECLGVGVEVSCLYDFIDDGTDPRDPEHHFGLLDHDARPKKSYEVLKRLTQLTADLQTDSSTAVSVYPMADRPDANPIVWDGTKEAALGTIRGYCFQDRAGRRTIAIWSAEHADGDLNPRVADVEFHTRMVQSIESTDLFTGQEGLLKFQTRDGKVRIEKMTVPDYPILLRLN